MRFLVGLILVFLSLLYPFSVMAQPCGGAFPPCDPGDPVPLTGVEFLIGAGVLLGVKMLKQAKRHK